MTGTTYNFSVEVIAGTRVSSKSAAITTVSYDAPTLTIADYTVRVTASKPFRIQTQVESTEEVSYIWE